MLAALGEHDLAVVDIIVDLGPRRHVRENRHL